MKSIIHYSNIVLGAIITLVIFFLVYYIITRRRELFEATPVYRPLPAPYNMLTSEEIQDRDTDILRAIRYQDAPPPSLSFELDFFLYTNFYSTNQVLLQAF